MTKELLAYKELCSAVETKDVNKAIDAYLNKDLHLTRSACLCKIVYAVDVADLDMFLNKAFPEGHQTPKSLLSDHFSNLFLHAMSQHENLEEDAKLLTFLKFIVLQRKMLIPQQQITSVLSTSRFTEKFELSSSFLESYQSTWRVSKTEDEFLDAVAKLFGAKPSLRSSFRI